MSSSSLSLTPHYVFGVNSHLQKQIFPVHNEVLYIAGRYLAKLNIETGERVFAFNDEQYKPFSCLTVHKQTLYLAERGYGSSILLCNLKDLKVIGTLDAKSNQGYSCLDIRSDGCLLCGVTLDGYLTLWDLIKMQIVMYSKACDENVFHGAFSLCDDNMIVTAGMNHLKLWRIEETFTGLKLNGNFCKFGNIDICNTVCYLQLQNGAIITGNESGFLLLWAENNVKCMFIQLEEDTNENDKIVSGRLSPLHNGSLNSIYYDKNSQRIITGGGDGMLKWWKSDSILCYSESDCHPKSKCLSLMSEKSTTLHQYGVSNIDFISPFGFDELIVKGSGKLFKFNLSNRSIVICLDFHQGRICGMDVSPNEHLCATGGNDRKIYCVAYDKKQIISSICTSSKCTCIAWFPATVDNRTFVVGFEDGSIKFMQLLNGQIEVTASFQPFGSRVEDVKFHPSISVFASSNDKGNIFLFEYNTNDVQKRIVSIPLGFLECKRSMKPNFWWKDDGCTLQFTNDYRKIYSADLKEILTNFKHVRSPSKRMTYKLDIPISSKDVTNIHEHLSPKNTSKESTYKESFDGKFTLEIGQDETMKVWKSDLKSNVRVSSIKPAFFLFSGEESLAEIAYMDNIVETLVSKTSSTATFTLEDGLKQQLLESKNHVTSKQRRRIYESVTRMRTEMLSVRQLNSTLVPNVRLPQSDFFLHSFFTSMYDELKQNELKKVKTKKLEFSNMASRRFTLQETFISCLEDEFVKVSSFERNHEIQCVPIMKRGQFLVQLQDMSKQKTKTQHSERKQACPPPSTSDNTEFKVNCAAEEEMFQPRHRQTRSKKRKELRKKRNQIIAKKAAEYKALDSVQHTHDALKENKVDNECRLKSSEKYGVPMKNQLNVGDKIHDLLICEESIYEAKKSFNAQVKNLHKKRFSILEDVEERNSRVQEIQSELYNVSTPLCYTIASYTYSTSVLPQLMQFSPSCAVGASKVSADNEMKENIMLLEVEKSKMLRDSSNSFEKFDDEVWDLIKDMFEILLKTKLDEVRLSNLLLELNMLRDLDNRSEELKRMLEYLHHNYIEITKTLKMYEEKLETNKGELHSASEQKARIMQEFDILVPTTNQSRDDLFNIFMRGRNDKVSEFLHSDSFDESFFYASEEEDICPDTCPSHLFINVLNLRERRNLNYNEVRNLLSVEEKLQYHHHLCASKSKQSEKAVEKFLRQINDFEASKLNELDNTVVTTMLSTKQVYMWEDDSYLDPILNLQIQFLILPTQHLIHLIRRYWEMTDEMTACKTNLFALDSELKNKLKKSKELEDMILIENQRCEELQLLKFGQKVDIDAFDQLSEKKVTPNYSSVNKGLEKDLKKKEVQIRNAERTLVELRQELKEVLNRNTELLTAITESIDPRMNLLNKDTGVSPENADSADSSRQKNTTDDLVQLKMTSLKQRKEIYTLEKDIDSLKRKDGKFPYKMLPICPQLLYKSDSEWIRQVTCMGHRTVDSSAVVCRKTFTLKRLI